MGTQSTWAKTRVVRKELEAGKVQESWEQSAWAKRMQMKAKRSGLTDFDRFKLRKAKSARNDCSKGTQHQEETNEKSWKDLNCDILFKIQQYLQNNDVHLLLEL